MSVVTNVILVVPIVDIDPPLDQVNQINDTVGARFGKHCGFFSYINDVVMGPKSLETNIFVGAFNHLEVHWFIEIVRNTDWNGASPQLMIQEQDAERFGIIEMGEKN